jgi:penicillin-insensitive murein DD-endopeptidase
MHAAANEIRLSASLRADGLKERIAWQSERIEMAAGRKISRGTGILATIGATAPFVGLFGTVWGIMDSFIGISKAHTTNLAVVAPGIAEAFWQVMRVLRNRYWGNPSLVAFIERLADSGKRVGWNGRPSEGWELGNGCSLENISFPARPRDRASGRPGSRQSQPRGGPMLNGHSSHQIGLDVDIWFTPMPDHELSREEREFNMALNMVAKDRPAVDPKVWTYERTALVRAAAQDPVVARVFVNPAIKKAMCREAGSDRSWLSKVRPWWGHDEHFHVRIACPSDSPQCKPQPPAGSSDGCGQELDSWLKESLVHPPATGATPKHNFSLAAMPKECRAVAKAP